MKKLFLIAVLLVACKKENREVVTITVLETGTNTPVSGAKVELIRINLPTSSVPTFLFTGVTGADGVVRVPAEQFNPANHTSAGKDKYWEANYLEKRTTLNLVPEGWLKLRLHRMRNYSPTQHLAIQIKRQDDSQGGDNVIVTANTDSTLLLRGLGGLPNKIEWHLFGDSSDVDSTGVINNLPVPRFDTLQNITLEY